MHGPVLPVIPPKGITAPQTLARKTKNSPYVHSRRGRWAYLALGVHTCRSYVLSCSEYVDDCMFHCRVWGVALDNIVIDSVYVIRIVPRNFLGYSHALSLLSRMSALMGFRGII